MRTLIIAAIVGATLSGDIQARHTEDLDLPDCSQLSDPSSRISKGGPEGEADLSFLKATGQCGYKAEMATGLARLKELAERGVAAGQYLLGWWFDANKQDAEATRWFRKAAEQGLDSAQYMLAVAYSRGTGVQKDNGEALRWFRLAAKQELDIAQRDLGLWLFQGLGTERDEVRAFDLFQKAARQGNRQAMHDLCLAYKNGRGVKRDLGEAVRWCREGAERGEAMAQNSIGEFYFFGVGVPKDYEKAFQWLSKSANQGNERAQHNLAVMHQDGLGISKNLAEAIRLYRLAAAKGDESSQLNLGLLYLKGVGVERDPAEALRLIQLAANGGSSLAQYNLGVIHERGLGVPKNLTLAIDWYRKAADQGHADAQGRLKALSEAGKGDQRDGLAIGKQRSIADGSRGTKESDPSDSPTAGPNAAPKYCDGITEKLKAARNGSKEAQLAVALGQIKEGCAIPGGKDEGIANLRKLAEQGYAPAQHEFAEYLFRKFGKQKSDDVEAYVWYQRAAKQGHAAAKRMLCENMERGYISDRKTKAALECYEALAQAGDAGAWRAMAWMYRGTKPDSSGFSIPEDEEKAIELYKIAAERGDESAMYHLGDIYEWRDFDEARFWYEKCADRGDSACRSALNRLNLLQADPGLREKMYPGVAEATRRKRDERNAEEQRQLEQKIRTTLSAAIPLALAPATEELAMRGLDDSAMIRMVSSVEGETTTRLGRAISLARASGRKVLISTGSAPDNAWEYGIVVQPDGSARVLVRSRDPRSGGFRVALLRDITPDGQIIRREPSSYDFVTDLGLQNMMQPLPREPNNRQSYGVQRPPVERTVGTGRLPVR